MNDGDQILRAYAAITSIRANVPERHEVEARWVNEFNAAIAKLGVTDLGSGLVIQHLSASLPILARLFPSHRLSLR